MVRASAFITSIALGTACLIGLAAPAGPALAQPQTLPVIVPITGFLALEGTAQRNGALLALERLDTAGQLQANVLDSRTTPEGAATALARALSADAPPPAVVASIFGPQMLAMIPMADRAGMPLLTISGTARLTDLGSPNVFRFFPSDVVVKRAHARFAVEERGATRPGIVYQTTAYGQSGHARLVEELADLGVTPVLEEALAPSVRDVSAVIAKLQSAGADSVLLHLHSGTSALFIRQAATLGLGLPIIAGSAVHQPTTAALLDPAMLAGVCAETASSPVSAERGPIADFAAAYRARFDAEPDAFALAQYDAVGALLEAMADGAETPDAVRAALSKGRFEGLAMTYQSDGQGNMAGDAVIVCYDGKGPVPVIARRYPR